MANTRAAVDWPRPLPTQRPHGGGGGLKHKPALTCPQLVDEDAAGRTEAEDQQPANVP